jgi:prepilin-type N-terminal cleavage/methylation domain-containing protein
MQAVRPPIAGYAFFGGVRFQLNQVKVGLMRSRSTETAERTAQRKAVRPQIGCTSHTCRRAAFSLIELVIVMLVLSVFTAAAIPTFFDSLLFHRVESAARRVKSDLELVRQTARLTSSAQQFTVIGMTYTASNAITHLDRPGEAYFVDLSQSPYLLDALAANFGGFTEVSFDGYGSPSNGGTIILQARDHQCTVTLDGTTGQVTINSGHTRGRHAKVSVAAEIGP